MGDTNDVTPSFPLNVYTYHVAESASVSSTLSPSARATDDDLGSNGNIEYLLQSHSHPFQVDQSSGVVSLTEQLDREVTSTYTLILEAVDRGSPRRTGSIELRSVSCSLSLVCQISCIM